jgi:hemerythrin
MAIRWTKALSIGIEDIDAQHREHGQALATRS